MEQISVSKSLRPDGYFQQPVLTLLEQNVILLNRFITTNTTTPQTTGKINSSLSFVIWNSPVQKQHTLHSSHKNVWAQKQPQTTHNLLKNSLERRMEVKKIGFQAVAIFWSPSYTSQFFVLFLFFQKLCLYRSKLKSQNVRSTIHLN